MEEIAPNVHVAMEFAQLVEERTAQHLLGKLKTIEAGFNLRLLPMSSVLDNMVRRFTALEETMNRLIHLPASQSKLAKQVTALEICEQKRNAQEAASIHGQGIAPDANLPMEFVERMEQLVETDMRALELHMVNNLKEIEAGMKLRQVPMSMALDKMLRRFTALEQSVDQLSNLPANHSKLAKQVTVLETCEQKRNVEEAPSFHARMKLQEHVEALEDMCCDNSSQICCLREQLQTAEGFLAKLQTRVCQLEEENTWRDNKDKNAVWTAEQERNTWWDKKKDNAVWTAGQEDNTWSGQQQRTRGGAGGATSSSLDKKEINAEELVEDVVEDVADIMQSVSWTGARPDSLEAAQLLVEEAAAMAASACAEEVSAEKDESAEENMRRQEEVLRFKEERAKCDENQTRQIEEPMTSSEPSDPLSESAKLTALFIANRMWQEEERAFTDKVRARLNEQRDSLWTQEEAALREESARLLPQLVEDILRARAEFAAAEPMTSSEPSAPLSESAKLTAMFMENRMWQEEESACNDKVRAQLDEQRDSLWKQEEAALRELPQHVEDILRDCAKFAAAEPMTSSEPSMSSELRTSSGWQDVLRADGWLVLPPYPTTGETRTAVRIWYICKVAWCNILVNDTFFKPERQGQRWYCVCGARVKNGMHVVEVMHDGQIMFFKSERQSPFEDMTALGLHYLSTLSPCILMDHFDLVTSAKSSCPADVMSAIDKLGHFKMSIDPNDLPEWSWDQYVLQARAEIAAASEAADPAAASEAADPVSDTDDDSTSPDMQRQQNRRIPCKARQEQRELHRAMELAARADMKQLERSRRNEQP
jgi:hypothetical protein